MGKYRFLPIISFILLLAACGDEQSGLVSRQPLFDLLETPVGTVDFPVGCDADAAPLVERGVALLHHMMYDEANFVFSMADDRDPDCAMAYWGQAMTMIHPLWPDVPSEEAFARAAKLVEKSMSLGGHSDRENSYLQTTRAYFDGTAALGERERLVRYERAWKSVSDQNPGDLEAMAFYALALRAIADNGDPELRLQREAGRIAEAVLEQNANHPGAHHYVIHAYDYPALAQKALATANHYGKITPRVPHATHMMTHIYTRLGQWDEAVHWNTISADIAWEICVQTGEVNVHYTHALDYLAYAYLQRGEDAAVMEILNTAELLQPPYIATNLHGSAYAFAALPARIALERRDWEAAASLEPRTPASFPWDNSHDAYVAITHFARALAFAQLGRPEEATTDITALATMKQEIAPVSPYWAKQIEIQEITARAWQAYAGGDVEAGLRHMQQAAAIEASTEKHAVTPGEVLPAAELYGDMLLDAERFEEALTAYRSALQRAPRRYNSLYGAGKAAAATGNAEVARGYFAELLQIAGDAARPRPPAKEAMAYLK